MATHSQPQNLHHFLNFENLSQLTKYGVFCKVSIPLLTYEELRKAWFPSFYASCTFASDVLEEFLVSLKTVQIWGNDVTWPISPNSKVM